MISLNTFAAFRPVGALASHFFETCALRSELCSRDERGEHPQPNLSAAQAARYDPGISVVDTAAVGNVGGQVRGTSSCKSADFTIDRRHPPKLPNVEVISTTNPGALVPPPLQGRGLQGFGASTLPHGCSGAHSTSLGPASTRSNPITTMWQERHDSSGPVRSGHAPLPLSHGDLSGLHVEKDAAELIVK